MNRKRVILAALLGVFALCLVYAYVAMPRLEKAPPRAETERANRVDRLTEQVPAQRSTERINFDFLTTGEQPPVGAKRDIFRYGGRTVTRHPEAESHSPVVTVTESPAVMPVPVEVIQQALGRFTFLGFLEKASVKTVFLSSGGTLFLVKDGETFGVDGEFSVVGIDKNLLQVRHAGRDGLIEVPLIEQQKLSASVSAPVRIPREAVAPGPVGNSRVFRPQRRDLRPAEPQPGDALQEGQQPQELIEEYNPEERQEVEEPVKEDVIEGEANGKNQ